MNLTISGHHLEVTPAIREYVQNKLERVKRHFDQVIDIAVILTVDKKSGNLLTSPDIISRGFIYMRDSEELMNEFLKDYNVVGRFAGNTGAQMGGWFRKEIKTPDDIKGLKFRIAGLAGSVIAKMGGVPQQIGGGDIYPALEKGTIDAAEWVGPYDDEKLGFYKIAKYYYYPGWWEGNAMLWMYFNQEKYNALPKQYKEAIASATAEANAWVSAKYDSVNPAALKRLVGAGAVLKPFPPEVMDACWKASNELYKEIGEKNANFKKLYDSQVAFRGDAYLWTSVADFTMDSYMIRYRNAGQL